MVVEGTDAEADFLGIMTIRCREMESRAEPPYEVGIRLMLALQPLMAHSGYASDAYLVWGSLTDALDGPPNYARGLTHPQVEGLMRSAASEWLALTPRPVELDRYFLRWRDWPDSLANS
jgi:hypothetical protein